MVNIEYFQTENKEHDEETFIFDYYFIRPTTTTLIILQYSYESSDHRDDSHSEMQRHFPNHLISIIPGANIWGKDHYYHLTP